jgi:hypothetical protein
MSLERIPSLKRVTCQNPRKSVGGGRGMGSPRVIGCCCERTTSELDCMCEGSFFDCRGEEDLSTTEDS